MKVLFVAPRFLYPPLQGDRMRGYHFLRLLRQRHHVTLVAPPPVAGTVQVDQIVPQICDRWVPVHSPSWHMAARLGSGLLSSLPLQTLYFCPPHMLQQVQALVQSESFDLLHAHTARVAPAAEIPDLPRVIDFIDALSLNMTRRAQRERRSTRWLFHLEARRMASYERLIASRFDQQIISSPIDRDIIGASSRLHVVGNGVAIEQFPFVEQGRAERLIVFSGRMGYFPNADAALFFATHVLPLIRRHAPDTRFAIVGADPPDSIRALGHLPGIEVTGYVPRLQDYLERATLAVAPLQSGSGMQFKVIEAMASGAPVVATPFGLGGIAANDGEHLLIASDAETLASQVLRLFEDPALRQRLAGAARTLVERSYTWEHSVAELEHVYQLAHAPVVQIG